jgi:hypothetical protein
MDGLAIMTTFALGQERPIIDDLEPWLRTKLALINQIRYALSR